MKLASAGEVTVPVGYGDGIDVTSPKRPWRDTPHDPPGIDYAVDVVQIPIPHSRKTRKTHVNEELKIAINMGASPDSYRAMRAQTQDRPLAPNGYLSEDTDSTAGDLIDQCRNHLARMDDDADGISADARLDMAYDALKRARELRKSNPGGLGQHTHFVR